MKTVTTNESLKGTPPSVSPSQNPSQSVVAGGDKTPVLPGAEKTPLKIVRIQPQFGGGNSAAKPDAANEAKSIAVIARSYEPVIGKIVELFNNTSFRVFRFVAKNSLEGYKEITGRDEKEKAEAIASHTSLDKASRDLASSALSRIAARKIEREESLDYFALAAVGTDYLSGIATAVGELSSTRNEIREALEIIRKERRLEQPQSRATQPAVLNGGQS